MQSGSKWNKISPAALKKKKEKERDVGDGV